MNKFKKNKYIIDGQTFYAYNYQSALDAYRNKNNW